MNLDEYGGSGYLRKEDVPTPELVTIKAFSEAKFEDGSKKPVAEFEEKDRGLVLNATNRGRLKRAFGTSEVGEMTGKKVVIFVDEEVPYAGRITGGLRLRKPNAVELESGEAAGF